MRQEPSGGEETHDVADWKTRLLGVRQKLFAPFVAMVLLELVAGAGLYALTRLAISHVNDIYEIGAVQQHVSALANLSGEENLNLMLGKRGALSPAEWVSMVESLRGRSLEIEHKVREQGGVPGEFFRALGDFRDAADHRAGFAVDPEELEIVHGDEGGRLEEATRRLFASWHRALDDLERRIDVELEKLNTLGRRLPFLPFMVEIIEGGNQLAETIRHVRVYEVVKELALWAEIKYVDFLDSGRPEDLKEAREYFRVLRMRLNGISREMSNPEEKKIFMDLSGWTDVFDELLSDENSNTLYPYLPVALYRNGMPLFSAVGRQGEQAMKASYDRADLVGSSVGGLLQVYSWVLIFFAGLALMIAMLLGKIIMRQIARLHGGFARLGNGDFRVRLTVDRTDEIGALQRGFNRSASDLEIRERNLSDAREQLEDLAFRLQHYSENLEREVQNRTAELRRVNEELMHADRMKSEFMANMSHELRTPLNSIIGFSKVLLNGIDGPLNARQNQDLDLIHQSGKHLLNLINEVLDFAKIESGRLSLYPEVLDPREVAAQAIDTTGSLAAGKGLELSLRADGVLPLVRADRTRLMQILLNLIGNAVKFTEHGRVTIEVRPDIRNGVAGIAFGVSDTGPGISEEDKALIFEKFHQVDSSSTRRHGGSGLGLAISKELVELHGGTVSVESDEGQGSTFTVWIPVEGPSLVGK